MIERSFILLPCHSLEDFPVYHTGDDANSILANWTALWHPAIIARTRQTPAWHRADSPPDDVSNSFVVAPTISVAELQTGFAERVAGQNGLLVKGKTCRDEILRPLFDSPAGKDLIGEDVDASELVRTVNDFFALGYAYLQIQLMARMLRYTTYLDDNHFQDLLLQAVDSTSCLMLAQWASQPETTSPESNSSRISISSPNEFSYQQTRVELTKCFDLLLEERNRFYPMDAFLMDLTLVAPTTIGKSLKNQLGEFENGRTAAVNLLIDGETLEELATQRPDTLQSLKTLLNQNTNEQKTEDQENDEATADSQPIESDISDQTRQRPNIEVVSGQQNELPTQLMSLESVLHQIAVSNQTACKTIGRRYSIWARRRFGLANRIPGLLESLGFIGAVHATMDQGTFPEGSHPNIRWESVDGQHVSAVGRSPISAESPDAFLKLGVTLGESLDSAHTALMCFAHWPSKTCQWFNDLLNVASFGDALGCFVTFEDCLAGVDDPGFGEEFTPDVYVTPFLDQYVSKHIADPISKSVRYWKNEYRIRTVRAIELISLCLQSQLFSKYSHDQVESEKRIVDKSYHSCNSQFQLGFHPSRAQIDESIERGDDDVKNKNGDVDSVEGNCNHANVRDEMKADINRLADHAARLVAGEGFGVSDSAGKIDRVIVFNSCSFPRRVVLERDQVPFDVAEQKPVYAADNAADGGAIVDLPPMGFVSLVKSTDKIQKTGKTNLELVEDLKLRNEFFEIEIDPQTGGIRQLLKYDERGNLFSQQLSMRNRSARQSKKGGGSTYARMEADSVVVSKSNRICAEITSSGNVIDDGDDGRSQRILASFVQKTRVFRGIRTAEVEVEINPSVHPEHDAWNSYYCCRFAWPNESATVYRCVNETKAAVSERKFESPEYIEIDDAANRITIVNNGLPFHRKVGYRMLDSLLICGREGQRKFRFQIGLNLKNPKHQSSSILAPPIVVGGSGVPKSKNEIEGFLFHVDNRNIVATDWEAIFDRSSGDSKLELGDKGSAGKIVGVRARMLETRQKSGKVSILGPRSFEHCRKRCFDGRVESNGEIVDGKAVFDFDANEYFQIEMYW